ncbi:hypothetical protein DICPUDRAFT_97608 [Dictyostelium purpureum]|uniref:Uncharacterized protein n=1 Tax=Dictyostelium purpureum TaxID=5786 RepID=F0ZI85_DICPU|nr:uncharacterized protein DICPUDRAFT_97608 [Dictyostelium purpureum]EGC36331.1 hypothetical protein DICPUDRAFT_97608 [Dictyostelium purpureum]|eukprot:XP_003287146.1 hypothetical protein DICPUDRAFT_97608 [Dictyostelium purpureum]
MDTMTAREYAGIPAKSNDLNVKEYKKPGFQERKLDEDYFLYSIKNLLKDNLNEYPGKQLDRPNKLDLSANDDKELDLIEKKIWEEKNLDHEQRKETFDHFSFPPHMSPQEKCVDQLEQDFDDFNMLCLKDWFSSPLDLKGFDRTPAQDKDELKEMARCKNSLAQEKSKLPNKPLKKNRNKARLGKVNKKAPKRTVIRQTKTTTTRVLKKPLSEVMNGPTTTTEIISETFTKSGGDFSQKSLPNNDPKSKPKVATQVCYSVDLSKVNNHSWVWDHGQVKKIN